MPWWNEECDDVRRERARAVKQNLSDYNKIRYHRAKAICRLVFNVRNRKLCRTNNKAVWIKVKTLMQLP